MSLEEQLSAIIDEAKAIAERAEERDDDWQRGCAAGLLIAARLIARGPAATRGTAAEAPGLTTE